MDESQSIPAPTAEMEAHFVARTERHILLVQRYAARLAAYLRGYDPTLADLLLRRVARHDASKFAHPERTPYVWLTWRYRCQERGVPFAAPAGLDAAIQAATERHILTNDHHPEYWQLRRTALLNPTDRDAPPAQIVDATRMPPSRLAEMVADWCAVAEERGNTPRAWADRNVGVRWRFTPQQVDRIYEWSGRAWGPPPGAEL